MTAIDLPRPAWTDLDLAIAGGTTIADDKMIGEPVLHLAYPPMIPVENSGIALPGAAVMNNDIFPPSFPDLCLVDCSAHRWRKITPAPKPAAAGFWSRLKAVVFLKPDFSIRMGASRRSPARRFARGNLRRCPWSWRWLRRLERDDIGGVVGFGEAVGLGRGGGSTSSRAAWRFGVERGQGSALARLSVWAAGSRTGSAAGPGGCLRGP